ncbi:MAG TPA: hypothetical protein V6D08_05090 [Candidatus Obscuribacterales bacterium]
MFGSDLPMDMRRPLHQRRMDARPEGKRKTIIPWQYKQALNALRKNLEGSRHVEGLLGSVFDAALLDLPAEPLPTMLWTPETHRTIIEYSRSPGILVEGGEAAHIAGAEPTQRTSWPKSCLELPDQ